MKENVDSAMKEHQVYSQIKNNFNVENIFVENISNI